jgi:hypothetical protein
VDCRIQVTDEGNVRTITVAGRVMGEHIPVLLTACGQAAALRLDLSDVLSIDPIAADALRRIRDGGAQLVGVPPYIEFKLNAIPSGRRGV